MDCTVSTPFYQSCVFGTEACTSCIYTQEMHPQAMKSFRFLSVHRSCRRLWVRIGIPCSKVFFLSFSLNVWWALIFSWKAQDLCSWQLTSLGIFRVYFSLTGPESDEPSESSSLEDIEIYYMSVMLHPSHPPMDPTSSCKTILFTQDCLHQNTTSALPHYSHDYNSINNS